MTYKSYKVLDYCIRLQNLLYLSIRQDIKSQLPELNWMQAYQTKLQLHYIDKQWEQHEVKYM